MVYTNDPSRELISNDSNLKMIQTKNITRDSLNTSTKLPNTSYHYIKDIKETPKKEVHVEPRKFYRIKTEKKTIIEPYSQNTSKPLNTVYISSNRTESKNTILRGRDNNQPYQTNTSIPLKSNINIRGNTSINTRTIIEPYSDRNKYSKITTKITEVRNSRTKNENPFITRNVGDNKMNIIKTSETKLPSRSQIRVNRNDNKYDSGKNDSVNRNKIISVTTSKFTTNTSGTNKNDNDNVKRTEKITKIVIKGSSGSGQNTGNESVRLRLLKDKGLDSNDNKATITSIESRSIETDGNDRGTRRKFRAIKYIKK